MRAVEPQSIQLIEEEEEEERGKRIKICSFSLCLSRFCAVQDTVNFDELGLEKISRTNFWWRCLARWIGRQEVPNPNTDGCLLSHSMLGFEPILNEALQLDLS